MNEPKSHDRIPGDKLVLPIEVEIFVEPDGSVTFADLASDLVPIATQLDPKSTAIPQIDNASTDPRSGDDAVNG